MKTPRIFTNYLIFTRWIIIFSCSGFVTWSWMSSVTKYLSGTTAIVTIVNETDKFTYPSLTFCRTFKNHADMAGMIQHEAEQTKAESIEDIDLFGLITRNSFKRTDFLTLLSHSERGRLEEGVSMLSSEAVWTESIPHPKESGLCFTYDPPFESGSGQGYGIRFGISFPEAENKSESLKEELLLTTLNIFVHEKGNFMYYEQDDRPNSAKLDNSQFVFGKETTISLQYRRFTRLSTQEAPCTHDPSQDFNGCLEQTYSEIRGCQAPWNTDPNLPIPNCTLVEDILAKFQGGKAGSVEQEDWSRPHHSTTGLGLRAGCPFPCASTKFGFDYSYKDLSRARRLYDGPADWVVYLYFKNYEFSYEEEYLSCDWTCLLGELGGSLGFFLGGSVVAYLDGILNPVLQSE